MSGIFQAELFAVFYVTLNGREQFFINGNPANFGLAFVYHIVYHFQNTVYKVSFNPVNSKMNVVPLKLYVFTTISKIESYH